MLVECLASPTPSLKKIRDHQHYSIDLCRRQKWKGLGYQIQLFLVRIPIALADPLETSRATSLTLCHLACSGTGIGGTLYLLLMPSIH